MYENEDLKELIMSSNDRINNNKKTIIEFLERAQKETIDAYNAILARILEEYEIKMSYLSNEEIKEMLKCDSTIVGYGAQIQFEQMQNDLKLDLDKSFKLSNDLERYLTFSTPEKKNRYGYLNIHPSTYLIDIELLKKLFDDRNFTIKTGNMNDCRYDIVFTMPINKFIKLKEQLEEEIKREKEARTK